MTLKTFSLIKEIVDFGLIRIFNEDPDEMKALTKLHPEPIFTDVLIRAIILIWNHLIQQSEF